MNPQQVVRIDGQVKWDIRRSQNGNYIAVCVPLKLTLEAVSLDELAEDIAYALDALLKDLLDSNEFNHFLREHGWVMVGSMPERIEQARFEVPFYLAMQGHGSSTELHQ